MFITFEGIEGSGKSTLALRLKSLIAENSQFPVLLTREPGGSGLGRHLRTLLLDPTQSALSPQAELFLYLADRSQHVAETIRPALDQGQVVIADRFSDSTLAYQGYGRGLDLETLNQLNDLATQSLQPDVTLLIDLPAEMGLDRALSRNRAQHAEQEGRFEAEDLKFHRRVRQGFLQLASANPGRFLILDGTQNQDQVFQELCHKLKEMISCRKKSKRPWKKSDLSCKRTEEMLNWLT